ncbi:family 20 glycosylhydrolase, partial [candidate division KSB1 bacterium]|nr:family 20 glycosylhydrolase [candidate division KSB1 bacterium]
MKIGFALACVLLIGTAGADEIKVDLMQRLHLTPTPQFIRDDGDRFPFPLRLSIQGLPIDDARALKQARHLVDLLTSLPNIECRVGDGQGYSIDFATGAEIDHPEGYVLHIDRQGIQVLADTPEARFYAIQTLYQVLAFSWYGTDFLYPWETPVLPDAVQKRYLPALTIRDYPRYEKRGLMLDLGRAVFTTDAIKRIIRLMAQLKLNTLHLHLYDDEIGGYRFETLPLGSENPLALSKTDLLDLIAYADDYYIQIMPELESWGHVKSVIYHYPELYGGPGMYGGASFAIGEKTFDLLEKMYGEIADCLPDTATIHVGLDEAIWVVAKGEEDRGYTPEKLVGTIYEI